MAYNFNKEFEIRDLRNGDWFWVNQTVLADQRLTPADNKVYSGLACFVNQEQNNQLVFPSVNTLAEKVVLSPRQIKASTKRLEEFGYIKKIPRQSGNRTTYVLLKVSSAKSALVQKTAESSAEFSKSGANLMTKISPINKHIEQSFKITNNNTLVLHTNGAKPQFGNPDINICFNELTKLLGNKPAKETLNRYAIKRLITKLGGVHRVVAAINYAFKIREEDRYAPRIYNFMDLEDKLENLKGYGKQKTISKSINVEEGIAYLERKKSSVNVD